MLTKNQVMDFKVMDAISSPGHDRHFCTDEACRDIIFEHADYIAQNGIINYLNKEYKNSGEKNIIINVIGETCYVVDGNKHLVAIMLSGFKNAHLTFGELEEYCPGLLRIWFEGSENGNAPYDVYIPVSVNTDRIEGVRITKDYFKAGYPDTKVVSGALRFDDDCFDLDDRGKALRRTYSILRRKYEIFHICR